MTTIRLTPRPATGQPPAGDQPVIAALTRLAALPADHPDRRQLREQVIVDLLPVAAQLARRFHDRGESHEDLRQVAALALVGAVDRFDPARGDFFPFAVTTITGALKRHLRDRGWSVRPPRRLQELAMEVRWAESQLGQTLGRPATAADVAALLGVDEERVAAAMLAYRSRRSTSLQAPVRVADVPLLDVLGADDRRLDAIDCWISLRPLIGRLPARTRRILELRFRDDLTQCEIAARVGLSQMHVSRTLAKTMRALRSALEAS
jgi:RNA polymerase sigma-B factor